MSPYIYWFLIDLLFISERLSNCDCHLTEFISSIQLNNRANEVCETENWQMEIGVNNLTDCEDKIYLPLSVQSENVFLSPAF